MLLFLLGAALAAPHTAQAQVVFFTATDLPDSVGGQDLWRYSYQISGFTFEQGGGFSIFFDPDRYTSLQDPPPSVGSDWSLIALQPDIGLGSPGLFDGEALVNTPSLAGLFSIEFVWTGTGTPGAQPFEFRNSAFEVIADGVTTAIPEPATVAALTSVGALAFAILRRRLTRIGASLHAGSSSGCAP